VQQKASTVRL